MTSNDRTAKDFNHQIYYDDYFGYVEYQIDSETRIKMDCNKCHTDTANELYHFHYRYVYCSGVMKSTVLIYSYLPILMIAGVITGFLLGIVSSILLRRLQVQLKTKFSV